MTGRAESDSLSRARDLSLAGLLGALGLLLPIGFHAFGWAGKVFLPMHLPIVVAGFLLSPGTAASLGALVPLLSAVLTGMPPLAPPIALLMSVELLVKAAAISILYRRLHLPMWFVLPFALLLDWAVLMLAAAAVGTWFGIDRHPVAYAWAVIVLSWPGTLLQLIGVPLAVRMIVRRVPRLAARQIP